jgi:hypothetical protein
MVASSEALPFLRKVKVNRTWDLSDHWPLECLIRTVGHVESTKEVDVIPPRLDVKKLLTLGDNVKNNNYWQVLGDLLIDEENVDVMAERFEETVQHIATDLDAFKPVGSSSPKSYRLNRSAKVAISRRRKAYKRWLQDEAPEKGALYNAYLIKSDKAKKEKKACSQASWLRYIVKGSLALAENDMKGFWNWAKQILGKGRNGPSDLGPLYRESDQTLIYNTKDKMEVVRSHYEALLGDSTGHSKNAEYWQLKLPGPPTLPIEGLNDDLGWGEINNALHQLRSGASGRDGIPPEFYKLAFEQENVELLPSTDLGRILSLVLTKVWDSGIIPDRWNEAWVVSIFKDGDPKSMNNYRGISLIVVVLKILTKVITNRLGKALESMNWFSEEQAGFRSLEECVGHVCALHEILKRRSLMRKRTYVAFVDIKKAYDSVPIQALLRKLELLGVSGKSLGFFQALYSNPVVRVRTKNGLSELIPQLRGLKQGCNASPLLFNIFINDIMAGCKRFGVKLIGIDSNQREVGLLFADDLALICGQQTHLKRALKYIQRWADTYEMTFGIDKCGLMGFGEGASERLRVSPERWTLSGRTIPIVDSYKYLGLIVTSNLDLDVMVKDRVAKGVKALNAMRPVLACVNIPVDIRIRAIRAMLVPVLSYGGELWGMNEERSVAPQRILTEALKLVLRVSAKSTLTSPWTLGLEFNVAPIHCVVSAARARAFRKFGSLRTTVAKLLANLPVASRKTWASGSILWLKRYCREAAHASASVAASLVRSSVLDRLIKSSKSKTANHYINSGFEKSRGYLKTAVKYPNFSRGVHWLCRLRVGAFWTIRRFVHIGWLPERWLTTCPFCNSVGSGETVQHMVLECHTWEEFRCGQFTDLSTLLGGSSGVTGGVGLTKLEVESWCGTPESTHFQPDLLPQDGENEEMNLDSFPGFLRMTVFLCRMIPVRQRRLNLLLRDAPRANANFHGMADFAEDQPFRENPG